MSESEGETTPGAAPAGAPSAPAAGAAPAAADAGPAMLLGILARALPPEQIDELWLFPPRPLGDAVESTVVVVSAFEPADDARRRVLTARFTVRRDPKGAAAVEQDVAEHGTAPTARVPVVVDGVLRRLDEDAAAAPRHARIRGEGGRWSDFVASSEAGA